MAWSKESALRRSWEAWRDKGPSKAGAGTSAVTVFTEELHSAQTSSAWQEGHGAAWRQSSLVILDCWVLYPPMNPGGPDVYLSERWGRGSRGHRAPGGCRHLLSDSLLWVGTVLPSLGRQLARSLVYTLVPTSSGYLGRGRPKTSILYLTVCKVSSQPCPSSKVAWGRGAIHLYVTLGFPAQAYCTGTEHLFSP